MAWLEASGVTKTFEVNGIKVRALRDVSFSVDQGEFLAIVGRSGCGKTTLLRAVSGLIPAEAGEISIGGRRALEADFRSIGIVFQEPRLMPWLTVEKNILFPFLSHPNPPKELARELISMLGLGGFENAWPSQLSGGMAQRVALGRALCYNPKMLMMDEPLGSLDYFTRRSLQKEILRIHREREMTIMFVTHDIDEAILMAGRILVMHQGGIVEDVRVDMPYPRDPSMSGFSEARDRVLSLVE